MYVIPPLLQQCAAMYDTNLGTRSLPQNCCKSFSVGFAANVSVYIYIYIYWKTFLYIYIYYNVCICICIWVYVYVYVKLYVYLFDLVCNPSTVLFISPSMTQPLIWVCLRIGVPRLHVSGVDFPFKDNPTSFVAYI